MSEPAGSTAQTGEAAPAPRRTGQRAWIMVVLVLGVAGIALLVMDRRAPQLTGPLPGLEGEPDFYMEGAVVNQFRADGSLEYRLESEEIRHFQTQALTALSRPRLTLFDPDQAPWQLSAVSGTLQRPPVGAPEETVNLTDDVTLEQTRPNGDHIRMTTPALTLYPRRQYAETDRDVMIESLVGRTTATGLKGDLQIGMLTFHSSDDAPVHTVLQPDQFK